MKRPSVAQMVNVSKHPSRMTVVGKRKTEDENEEPFLTHLFEAKPQKKDGLVQAEGSNLEGHMAEEEPVNPNACPECLHYPCILNDTATIEEGHAIVNEMMMDRIAGLEVNNYNFRYVLCRMCTRHLCCCDMTMLPRCVYHFINKHFKEEGEPSTCFRERNAWRCLKECLEATERWNSL